MNKLVLNIFYCLSVFILWAGVAVAAPVGCPSPVKSDNFEDIPFSIGFESDYIFERLIENREHLSDEVTLEGFWAAGKINYTWFGRLDTYLLLGGMDWNVFQKQASNTEITYNTNMEFAWGWGAGWLLLETDDGISVKADTRYRAQKPEIESVKVNKNTTRDLSYGAMFREWQISLAVSKDMSKVIYTPQKFRYIPYAGVKFSKLKVHTEARINNVEYKVDQGRAADQLGVFAGCDIYLKEAPENEEFVLNIEGRFVDEMAVTAGIIYKF